MYIIFHSPKTFQQPRARVVCEKYKNRPPNVREKRINDLQTCSVRSTQVAHNTARAFNRRIPICVYLSYIIYHGRAELSDLFTCHPSGQPQPPCTWYIRIMRYAVIRLGLRAEGQAGWRGGPLSAGKNERGMKRSRRIIKNRVPKKKPASFTTTVAVLCFDRFSLTLLCTRILNIVKYIMYIM